MRAVARREVLAGYEIVPGDGEADGLAVVETWRGLRFASDVHHLADFEGHIPLSSTRSSRVFQEATGARTSGTPGGIVFCICSIVPGHSTLPRGA